MKVYKITGKVISSETKEGLKGLRVEAWDKDLLVNDMVGSAITGEGGVFRIQFDESYFKELFLDRKPDLFFKVFKGSKLIKSTKDSVLWNVDREDIQQTIEVKEGYDMATSKNKGILVRERGSEVFKFVTLRPFQRQDEDQIEKKRVLCYKTEKSEFHNALLEAKENPPEGYGPREAMIDVARNYIETSDSTFIRNIHDLWNPQAFRSTHAVENKSSIGLLEEWIFRSKKPISYEDLLTQIKNTYKKDTISDIVQDPGFRTDKDRLQDSIIALAIVPSHPHPHRDRLVNALRICRIIERMADNDESLKQSYAIDKAMKAPVVLPPDVFPLPPAKEKEIEAPAEGDTENQEELRKLREKRNALKTAIEELTHLQPDDYTTPPQPSGEDLLAVRLKKADLQKLSASTNKLLKEIGIDLTKNTVPEAMRLLAQKGKTEEARAKEFHAAMDELATLASSKLPQLARQPSEEENVPQEAVWKPWTLKPEAIERLSNTTRQVLEEMGFDLTKDPVPTVVNALEEELARVGLQLFRPPRRRRVIQRGVSRLEFLPGLETRPWRPEDLEPIRVPQTKGLVQPVGIGEYNSVRQTLLRYEPGEIAHIENVLRGEYKERVHRRLRRLEEEITYEEERKATTEKDLQSTDRFELKREASETIKEEHKADAGVTVKYDGPTVDVETKAGYNYSNAKEQAKKTSVSYARDVTQRSVSKLEEKVREMRVVKTIEEFEETNTHGIDNKEKPDHAIGIYRWVDKIYEAQVINYGQRLFFDFIVPEPAAFYLYALIHGTNTDLEEPLPPMVNQEGWPCFPQDEHCRPLEPRDLDHNWQYWIQRYEVAGVKPKPSPLKYFSIALKGKTEDLDETRNIFVDEKEIKIEDGYNLQKYWLNWTSSYLDEKFWMHIFFGPYKHEFDINSINQSVQGLGALQEGKITLAVNSKFSDAYTVVVHMMCGITKEAEAKWQLDTYDAIMQAYLKQKSDYEEKLAAAAIEEGVSISGRNPEQNREIEETELKRWALSMITGQHFELFNAMQKDRQGWPGINFAEAEAEDRYIRFFEQAFEWPLMTYLFYLYFWGKRQASWEGGPTWIDKITSIQDVDPLFEKFLKAGAARVTVPVRPGFEDAIMNYLSTGEIWNGEAKPTIDDPLYVSIVEEIQQQQGAYVEKTGGTISVTQGSMEVTGTGTNFDPDTDVEREIYIEGKRYIIAEVQDATHLTLTEPYRGETKEHARYYIGARLVGGPWEVRVPTSLVYLQEDATLPEFNEGN